MNATHAEVVAFLSGHGLDNRGRDIFQYLEASVEDWESSHDMIQWAFPLEVASNYNPNAPLFDRNLFALSEVQPTQEFLRRVQRMLFRAYCLSVGIFAINEDDPHQMEFTYHLDRTGYNFPQNSHQHLRVTRIITSLRLFGQEEIAKSFCDFMVQLAELYPDRINNTTVEFWTKAATEPL